MYSKAYTALLDGIRTVPVTVEVDVSSGLPTFEMVGYLASEVKEARERVRTALHNAGIMLPAKRITLNLSPGNIRKSGTGFDLPMAMGMISALGMVEPDCLKDMLIIGELTLSGSILPVNGVLPIVADGRERGITRFIVPAGNIGEARLVKEAEVYGFSHFRDLISFVMDGVYEEPADTGRDGVLTVTEDRADFSQVNGQHLLKRACEVAAAGMHNMLMIGPPGSGKTMIAQRLPTILPELDEEERLELSKIYSVSGMLDDQNALLSERPFRSPHHTVSKIGLTGGGLVPRPGEISLAHHGVLFLDELTEFPKKTMEVLRQPMEEKKIHLTRGNTSITYPSDFLLLAAMNPCGCGNYPNMQKCRCTESERRRYFSRVSQPLVDRIDLCVEARPLSFADLTMEGKEESSDSIRERVMACRNLQRKRYGRENFTENSRIPGDRIGYYCSLGPEEEGFMKEAFLRMDLTGRTYHKILRVARTIADLEGSDRIAIGHLQEACCFRNAAERFWGGNTYGSKE